MNLKDQLLSDMKVAMKSGDKIRLSTIRMLRAKISELEIAKNRDLTEDELIGVLISNAKQHADSIEQYQKGGREDLVEIESKEKEIVELYLPAKLSDDEIKQIIKEALDETKDLDPKQRLGNTMKIVMNRVKGRADGKLISQMVREALQG